MNKTQNYSLILINDLPIYLLVYITVIYWHLKNKNMFGTKLLNFFISNIQVFSESYAKGTVTIFLFGKIYLYIYDYHVWDMTFMFNCYIIDNFST